MNFKDTIFLIGQHKGRKYILLIGRWDISMYK